jgi:hypothetical protein
METTPNLFSHQYRLFEPIGSVYSLAFRLRGLEAGL